MDARRWRWISLFLLFTWASSAATSTNWFRITTLTTNNVVYIDEPTAGHLAASPDYLFAGRVGDSSFRRWDAAGLANPTNTSSGYTVISDLRTETLYVFGDDDGPMSNTGSATRLYELDPATAETNGAFVVLSQTIDLSDTCGPEFGIFSGWGRAVVGHSSLVEISLPGGIVSNLNVSNPFNQFCDPSEPLAGVAEFFGDELYLVGCQPNSGGLFERVQVSNGARTTLAEFPDLPRSTKLTFVPSLNRWYFSTDESWLNSDWYIVGYADATWDQNDDSDPPPPLTIDLPSNAATNEDFAVTINGLMTQREGVVTAQIRPVSSTNPSLLPTNAISIAPSSGFFIFDTSRVFTVTFTPLPDTHGTADILFITSNDIGEAVSNVVTVTIHPVNDAPQIDQVTPSLFTNEGQRVSFTVSISDVESPAAVLGLLAESLSPALVHPDAVLVTGTGTHRTVSFQFTPDVPGDLEMRLTVIDPEGGIAVQHAFIVVQPDRPKTHLLMHNTDLLAIGLGGLRNHSSATTTVTGITGPVTQALLVWNGPRTSSDRSLVFQGQSLTGISAGEASDNCWEFAFSQTLWADVTALVSNDGPYVIDGYRAEGKSGRDLNGISLLIFHDDGNPANNRDVALFLMNDSNVASIYEGELWNRDLTGLTYTGGTATLTLHISDGQTGVVEYADAALSANGQILLPDGHVVNGDTVPLRAGSDPALGLWDIMSFDAVPLLSNGQSVISIATGTNYHDCISLVAATVDFPAGTLATGTEADLAVDLSAAPGPFAAGAPVSISVTLTNRGPLAVTATVTNLLPFGAAPGAAVPSAGSVLTNAWGEVIWSAGSLAPAEAAELTLTFTPFLEGTNYVYSFAAGNLLDPVVTNNTALLGFGVTNGYPVPPVLTHIEPMGSHLLIYWNPPSPGYALQETDDLINPGWTFSPSGLAVPGTSSLPANLKFFRLLYTGPQP